MLTMQDCLDHIGLTEDEVYEVAHHDHISLMCAIEECSQMLEKDDDMKKIQEILLDNIVEAHDQHWDERERSCILTYGKFVVKHCDEI